MAKKTKVGTRSIPLHVMLKEAEDRLYRKAADAAGVDLSNFVRIAANEKIDRMRAEGKKL